MYNFRHLQMILNFLFFIKFLNCTRGFLFESLRYLESAITQASVGKHESENASRCWSPKGGHGPGVPCVDRGNWARERGNQNNSKTECRTFPYN